MHPDEMNRTFQQHAALFTGKKACDEEIPFAEKLDRAALDGSIESLKVVDGYLSFLHENLGRLTDADFTNLALRCGGYVGECIRMTWPESYDWCEYDDYMLTCPDLESVIPERNLGTCALLARGANGMVLPLNKVLRYLHEGPENSVHFFADCERPYHRGGSRATGGMGLTAFCRCLASFVFRSGRS